MFLRFFVVLSRFNRSSSERKSGKMVHGRPMTSPYLVSELHCNLEVMSPSMLSSGVFKFLSKIHEHMFMHIILLKLLLLLLLLLLLY